MAKILFVDDDVKYQMIIKELLELENYEVDTADDVVDGFMNFKENHYDLVITDFQMDKIDGLQFVKLLRKKNPDTKIIMLTGINDDGTELQGLDLAINDYIKKPVGFDVLLKRIELVLKQDKVFTKGELKSESANILVNLTRRKVFQNGTEIELTPTEFNLLSFFLEHKNIVFSREKLLENVWHAAEYIDIRTVDTHIKKLRSKISIPNVYSIRGVGYEWVE